MSRPLLAPLLVAALLAPSGCGVVEDSARQLVAQALGEDAASLLGESDADAPAGAADGGGASGFTIAADDDAADAVVADDEEGAGTPGFYKIVEPNGTVRFTSNLESLSPEQRSRAERLAMAPSKPNAKRAAPTLRSRIEQIASGGGEDAQPPASRARAGASDVVIYTTSWCGWCDKTRKWLDAKGVTYVDKDVERDEEAADEMRRLAGGGAGVPVVVIDGEVIRGFNQSRMEQLL